VRQFVAVVARLNLVISRMRVLLVEDDPIVVDGVKAALEGVGFAVDRFATAEGAEMSLPSDTFALAIVDLGLPGMNGMELIRRLRHRGNRVPVMILSARDNVKDVVEGLGAG